MLLEQAVDVLDLCPRTGGDALFPRRLHNFGIAPLLRGHGQDDGALARDDLVVELGRGHLFLEFRHARQQAHNPAQSAELVHLGELFGEIVEIELAFAHLVGDALRLFGVDGFRGLLDQGDNVAHAEDAIGDALGMEIIQRVHFFARADQLDRLAGDGAHRERGAATAVAVDAGQHDAGDADAVVEIFRQIDRVLAGERIGDEQDFVGFGGGLDLGHLRHQGLVDMSAAGRIEHDHVIALQPRRLLGAARDLHRRLAGDDRQSVDADLAAEYGELFLRRRPFYVERGHQHALPETVGQALGDFRSCGGLARALQADHHDRYRRRGVEVDRLGVRAQGLDQDVIDDLDDHLAGGDRFKHLRANGARTRLVDEGARHIERHIRFEKRAAHFAHGGVDVLFAERSAPCQAVEYF